MYLLVARQLFVMALTALASYIFSRFKKIGAAESRYLSNLLLFFISPCLILNTFTIDFDAEKLRQISLMMFLQFCIEMILIGISVLFIHSKKGMTKRDPIDKMAVIYSNIGFIGIPLINGVFGQEGVFLLMGCIIMFNIFLWTQGVFLVTGKISIKQILTNPNIIAIAAGFMLFVLPVRIPDVLKQTIKLVGDLNTAISMILLGILFTDFRKPDKKEKGLSLRILKTVCLRIVIAPLVLIGCMFLFEKYIFSGRNIKEILLILLIAASCPVGMNVANFSVLYDPDNSPYAGLLVSFTSLFCIVTIPVMVKIAEMVL